MTASYPFTTNRKRPNENYWNRAVKTKTGSLILFIFIASFFAASCASPAQKKEALLKSRTSEYYAHLSQKDFGVHGDILSKRARGDSPRDEYIQTLDSFFKNTTITLKKKEERIIRSDFAVSQAIITISIVNNPESFNGECVGFAWVWENNNWSLLEGGYVCSSEAGVVDDLLKYKERSE